MLFRQYYIAMLPMGHKVEMTHITGQLQNMTASFYLANVIIIIIIILNSLGTVATSVKGLIYSGPCI